MLSWLFALFVVVLLTTFPRASHAAFTFTLVEVPDATATSGFDVDVTGSGTFNLADLTSAGPSTGNSSLVPSAALLGIDPSGGLDSYTGLTGPSSWGLGNQTFASSSTGNSVAILGRALELFVPSGYVSNTPLLDSATFTNQTFSSLGINPGTYTYTWGTGTNADSLTVQVGAPVPEPSSWLLVAGGMVLIGFHLARRRSACAS